MCSIQHSTKKNAPEKKGLGSLYPSRVKLCVLVCGETKKSYSIVGEFQRHFIVNRNMLTATKAAADMEKYLSLIRGRGRGCGTMISEIVLKDMFSENGHRNMLTAKYAAADMGKYLPLIRGRGRGCGAKDWKSHSSEGSSRTFLMTQKYADGKLLRTKNGQGTFADK